MKRNMFQAAVEDKFAAEEMATCANLSEKRDGKRIYASPFFADQLTVSASHPTNDSQG